MNNYPTFFASVLAAWRRPLVLLALAGPLLVACDKDEKEPSTTYGPKVQVGSGTARSFVTADDSGKPTEIGVAVSEASLSSLPATPLTGIMYDVALPNNDATSQMPFDHITFDWNPTGHEPSPIYTLPHFDAHFYMQPTAVQHSITLDDPKGDIFPAANKLPTGYSTPPNVVPGRTVPMMGRHWVDPTSPEYATSGVFTHTFIYGTYDGRVTFIEPMFTKAMLVPGVNIEQLIKQPAVYEFTGKYYPIHYTIRHDPNAHEYIISLKNMQMR